VIDSLEEWAPLRRIFGGGKTFDHHAHEALAHGRATYLINITS
jgi:hypothetical protein